MIKKLTIPVDHGNRNMKTTHFLFTTGLSATDRKPVGREDFLQTDGKYYVLAVLWGQSAACVSFTIKPSMPNSPLVFRPS